MDKRAQIRAASNDQEKRVARVMRGSARPASGATWHSKGDVTSAEFLIECKMTEAKSYRLDIDTLQKIDREALLEGKEFALFVEISGRRFVVVAEDTFVKMAEASIGTL